MAGQQGQDSKPRIKVAIIGGGCAGLAAAWELSKLPDYEVSVYEQSFRLGGKGASGRDANGRIKEHGLHVWLGFYENAFRMIRDCYKEVRQRNWGPHGGDGERLPHASFEDAFFPEPHIGVVGKNSDGTETVWSGYLPPAKGLPGDPLDPETNPFTLASYLLRCVDLLKTLILSVIGPPGDDVPGKPRPEKRSGIDEAMDRDSLFEPLKSPEPLIEDLAGKVRDGSLTVAAGLLQAVSIFENLLQDFNHSPQAVGSALRVIKALAAQARKQLTDVVAIDEQLRWKTEIIDIVMTIAFGLYRDRVLFGEKGLDAINHLDYREWLRKHGATKTSLESRFLTGIYDLVFAYEGGNRRKPRLAAGVALRGALRMFFTYRGAMFWRMRSGMGDAVFAPLYKVMSQAERKDPDTGAPRQRVTFHFLHKVSEIGFEQTMDGRRFVTRLDFAPPSSSDSVESGGPVLDDFGCWPERERWRPGQGSGSKAAEPPVLHVGRDFDAVIFATGLDDFTNLLKSACDREAATPLPAEWQPLLDRRLTVATKAAQVWLKKDLEGLGWYRGPGIISALGKTFDTWADMSQTLPSEEAWRRTAFSDRIPGDAARSVAYFCGVLDERDASNQGQAEERVSQNLMRLLSREMGHVWPKAFDGPAKAATSVVREPRIPADDEDAAKAERLFAGRPHIQANIEGAARYSLSLPGTIESRLSPLDRHVLNMSVAGDWTACGLDSGCVEAAVMSGMLAAHAITGAQPALASIVGYDHP